MRVPTVLLTACVLLCCSLSLSAPVAEEVLAGADAPIIRPVESLGGKPVPSRPAKAKMVHDLKEPALSAAKSNDVEGAAVTSKDSGIMHKVIKMINTHVSKHKQHKAQGVLRPLCEKPSTSLRFCAGLDYHAYRHSSEVAFDLLDYDAHKSYTRLVEHMVYSRVEVGHVESCKADFKNFLCSRDFPHCCDIRVCGAYGPPQIAGEYGHPDSTDRLVKHAEKTQQDAGRLVGTKGKTATTVTFFHNGTLSLDRDSHADNKTVLVKMQPGQCLYYNVTYTPFFDCIQSCKRLLSVECQNMLHTSCQELCVGQDNPQCATKHLLAVVKKGAASSLAPTRALLAGMVLVLVALLLPS